MVWLYYLHLAAVCSLATHELIRRADLAVFHDTVVQHPCLIPLPGAIRRLSDVVGDIESPHPI